MQAACTHSLRVFILAPAIVSWGLERLVESAHPRMELCGAASNAPAACDAMQKFQPHVVAIVIESEDDLAGVVMLQSRSGAKCLVLTSSHDTAIADKAVLTGARGVVRMWDAPASLLRAIEKVHDGELWIDRSATSRIFLEMARQKAAEGDDPEKTKIATLTQRERQAIVAVATHVGAPAKAIAQKLCISEHTLRNHLTSIYSKLEVSNRLELHAYATRHHLTEAR